MSLARVLLSLCVPAMLAALPASGTYKLNSYGFGTGGTAGSSSTNYNINGVAGEGAGTSTSTNYNLGAGEAYQKQANVPLVTISNPSSIYYNKLDAVITPNGNPSDAKYSIAISPDNFTSTTYYVKSDFTITATQSFSNYLTYSAWGGASGITIRGLARNTTYTAKATAYRGKFTESAYGPSTTASTVSPTVTFNIDVSAIDTSTNPPFAVNMGNLLPATVVDSPVRVWVTFDTNGESGGSVYLNGLNTGLTSATGPYTIPTATGDITSLTEGYGAQGASATQAGGGPLTLVSPYDGTGGNIGVIDPVVRVIFSTTNPLVAGRGSFIIKAKSKAFTPAASDYTDTLTLVESISF